MKKSQPKPYINADYFEDLTGDINKGPQPEAEAIGKRIRRIRESKGLPMEAMSKLTGLEVDQLAAIEADQIQPQLGTIIKLSKALDSAFGRIISGSGDRDYSITRKDEQTPIARSTSKTGTQSVYAYKSLAPKVKGRHMEALLVQLEEMPEEDMSIHEGEEFIYVLDGSVSLKIGEEAFELNQGDSAYYLSTTPHLIAAQHGRAAILAVIYEG